MIKAFINNFEIVEKAQIVVDGLVALVGETNNGKTAVYNSFYVLSYNVPGRDYIRKVNDKEVSEGTRIGMMFDDDNSIVFEKSDAPKYLIKTKEGQIVLDKVGRGGSPEIVSKTINMEPLDLDGLSVNLNFVGQLSEPLLRRLSDYQMYKIAVKSFDGEKLQEAIILCKKEMEAKRNELKLKTNEIEVQKKSRLSIIGQLEQYKPLTELIEGFKVYDNNLKVLPFIKGYYDKITQTENDLKNTEDVLQNFSIMGDISMALERTKRDVVIVNGLTEYNHRITTLEKEVVDLESKINGFTGLEGMNLQNHVNDRWTLQSLLNWNNTILDNESEINYDERKLSFLGEEFNDLLSMVRNHRQEEDKLDMVVKMYEKLTALDDDINVNNDYIEKLKDIPESDQYSKDVSSIQVLEGLSWKLSSLENEFDAVSNQFVQITEEVNHLQYMVDNNICPTCGNHVEDNINEHKH